MAAKKKDQDTNGATTERRKYRIKVAVELSAAEQLETKDAIITALQKVDDLEDAKAASAKDWRAQIVVAKTSLDELRASAAGVYDGHGKKIFVKEVELDCYDDLDHRTQTVFCRRVDTNEVVGNPKGRAMSAEERQIGLPGVDSKKSKADDAVVDDDYGKTNAERAQASKDRDSFSH